MVIQDLKETLDLKVSPALLDNKATLELRDFQALREQSDRQERRVPLESRDYRECQEQMDLRVTLVKKDLLGRKDIWDHLVLRGLLDILGLEV